MRDALGGAGRGPVKDVRTNGVVPAKVRAPGFVATALPRQRLEARLAAAFESRLTLVVAPAGSGKTTLIGRFAATSGAPVAWYRAESWDADEASFVRHVEAALEAAVPGIGGGWADITSAAAALEEAGAAGSPISPVLLVIDDLHTLEDTPAEAALGRLVDYAPAWLTIVVGSRVVPSFNLSRLRVTGELLEIGADDLRFRAWEVEQLFRDVYHDPVLPADLAVLARRTEGWAAGLQLFHLATRGRSNEERRRVLGGPGSSGRLLREYLAQNVHGRTAGRAARTSCSTPTCSAACPGRSAIACGATTGSGALLDELARRGVFTVPWRTARDDYRYHEVLRQHLDRMTVETHGEAVARDRHARGWTPARGRGASSPRRCAPTPAPRTGRRSAASSVATASVLRTAGRAAGSRSCRPRSSATTRGWRWQQRVVPATMADGRPRSPRMPTPSRVLAQLALPRSRTPSGWR